MNLPSTLGTWMSALKPQGCAIAAGGCIAGAMLLAAPGPEAGLQPSAAAASGQANPSLWCRLERRSGAGTQMVLVNTTPTAFPRGARFAWVSTGTPRPQGEVRSLPQPLGPGQRVVITSQRVVQGAGCRTAMLADPVSVASVGLP